MSPLTIQKTFELAVQHHQAGRLDEAELLYRQILANVPEDPGALHHLGVIAAQRGQNDRALELIRRAIALSPDFPEAHNNLGNTLRDKGQLQEAVDAYRRAVSLRPNYPEAYYNLGVALQGLELLDDAIFAFHRAIALNLNMPSAHYNLANTLEAVGKFEDAAVAYGQAVALAPPLSRLRDDFPNGPNDPRRFTADQSLSHLERVTLCCVDTDHPVLGLRAIRLSLAQCRFTRVLFFTNEPVSEPGVECHVIPPFSTIDDYSQFVLRGLASYLQTDFVLMIHWDGYVVDGSQWSDEFLNFDYIGAPWPWHKKYPVGNGGFSIRSRRLLQLLADSQLEFVHPEDVVICRVYRQSLEERGIRFADLETASRFALEDGKPSGPTLGFHGAHNFWRFLPRQELAPLLDLLPPSILQGRGMTTLLNKYHALGRNEEAREIVARRQT